MGMVRQSRFHPHWSPDHVLAFYPCWSQFESHAFVTCLEGLSRIPILEQASGEARRQHNAGNLSATVCLPIRDGAGLKLIINLAVPTLHGLVPV